MKRLVIAVVALASILLSLSGCWWEVPPVARFTMSPISGTSPLLVDFDASASTAGSADLAEYFWSFGDGTAGGGKTASHTYVTDESKIFVVWLTVTDLEGRQSQASKTVSVSPRVEPDEPTEPTEVRVEFVWPFNYDATGEDAAHLNDEYFTLQNTGDVVADMSGWTVESEGGDRYVFPDGFVLSVGAYVMVHSGAGTNTQTDLYMNASGPVWSNDFDIAILSDVEGTIVDIYSYASCLLAEPNLAHAVADPERCGGHV